MSYVERIVVLMPVTSIFAFCNVTEYLYLPYSGGIYHSAYGIKKPMLKIPKKIKKKHG